MSNTSLTSKVPQSRGWTLALGIGAAALAAILLIAYLVQYRSSVNDSTAPSPVLVAKNLIPKGTSGTVIAEKQLFQAATLSKDDLKVGAISDPAYLNGRVAVADIFPGQQITTADLSVGPHGRDPDPADREAARGRDPGQRRHAGSSATSRAATASTSTTRPASTGGTLLGLLAPNVLVMRAPQLRGRRRSSGSTRRSRRRSRSRPTRGTLWFLLRPAGDAKKPPEEVDHAARELLAQINGQTKR